MTPRGAPGEPDVARDPHHRPSRRPSVAVLLTRRVASRELIERRCALAASCGVRVGLDLAHARTLLPASVEVVAQEHDARRDAEALRTLALWALRFSPMVAPDPPDGLVIDLTGTRLVHENEAVVLRRVARSLARKGVRARLAVAPSIGCAWAVSRFGPHDVSRVPPGMERRAIERLPAAALRLDDAAVRGLAELGVTRVSHVLDLPRAGLASRFGPLVPDHLDRALGLVHERIDPVRPDPPPSVQTVFDGPTTQWEAIECTVRTLLDRLAAELLRLERGVRRLRVDLVPPVGLATHLEIVLSRPNRSAKHLWSLLRPRLEREQPALGSRDGVERVMLTAVQSSRLRHAQTTSAGMGADEQQTSSAAMGEMLDTLVSRLGADRVVRVEPVQSHLPERAFVERSVMHAAPARRAVQADPSVASVTASQRPTRLFEKPERVEVVALTPDGPVHALTWRGERHAVISTVGPERIAPEWWRAELCERPIAPARGGAAQGKPRRARAWTGPPPDRDYFAVQLEHGRWLWLCRQVGAARWYVHGEWA